MSRLSQKKITVVGAGYVGMTCAQLCAYKNLASEIVVIDVLDGRAKGIALDLNQSAAVEGFGARVSGTNDPGDTRGSDVVIMTAGLPRKPGMSRSDLLETNAKIISSVADYVRLGSPDAHVIVVTNPLDSMVHLMRAKTGFPGSRVTGMAGVLDSARFSWFIAEATKSSVQDVKAMVLGAHGDSMVPVPQYCNVNGVGIQQLLDKGSIESMATRTKNGGAEIVGLLKTGSAFFAPASSAVAMARPEAPAAGRVLAQRPVRLPRRVHGRAGDPRQGRRGEDRGDPAGQRLARADAQDRRRDPRRRADPARQEAALKRRPASSSIPCAPRPRPGRARPAGSSADASFAILRATHRGPQANP
jgi:malate dehydrogenase